MNTCDLCGHCFKSIQGLLGHQRMKHSGNGVQDSGQFQSNNGQSSDQHQSNNGQSSVQHQSNNGQSSDQHKSNNAQNSGQHQCSVAQDSQQSSMGEKLLSRDECLELIEASVTRVVAGMEPHAHGMDCDGCRDFLEEYMQENPDFFEPDPVAHDHGDNCTECVAREEAAGQKEMRRTALHFANLPGVKEIFEQDYLGKQVIAIVP